MKQIAIQIGGSNITVPSTLPHGGLSYLEQLIRNSLMVFLFVGICLVTIYIVWGGLQWIMSGGEKSKLAAARAKVTTAVIGFIFLLLSYTIVGAVGYLFKVDLLKF